MEMIEGSVKEIRNWSDGKGADVILAQDPTKCFFYGKMPIVPGPRYDFETVDGEGKFAGKKEIISAKRPMENRVPPPLPGQGPPVPGQASPQLPTGVRMIQLPMDDFNNLTKQNIILTESRFRSLDAAVRTYAAMMKTERDPRAAAREVIIIAKQLEGYLG